MRKNILAMIIIIAAICLISCGSKKIKAPRSADDYKGMNYEEAVMELQQDLLR